MRGPRLRRRSSGRPATETTPRGVGGASASDGGGVPRTPGPGRRREGPAEAGARGAGEASGRG